MFETFFESKECVENEREVAARGVVGNKLLDGLWLGTFPNSNSKEANNENQFT